jgi:hypothetical protein
MTDSKAIGSNIDVLGCCNVVLSMLVSIFLCRSIFFFCGFFGAFFLLITLDTLPERVDALAQILTKPAQPAYAEDEEYDHQYEYELWPTNFEWHFFPLIG